jgi:hypothetical protein
MRKESRYTGYSLLLLIPITILGFYKTYFSRLWELTADIHASVHFHAFVASLWILLLIVQPFLIYYKKHKAHRILGKFSYILFPVLLFTFVLMILRLYNRGEMKDALFPAVNTLLLLIFYIPGIFHRKRPAIHMRYMIATALVFLDPAIGRIVFFWFGGSFLTASYIPYALIDLILLLLIMNDKRHNKNYRPYLIALCFFFVFQVVEIVYLVSL